MASPKIDVLQGRTYIMAGPVNIGVIEVGSGEVVLIDAGGDDEAGRKLLNACTAAGWRVRHIANTHSNADHCGGNAFLQARTNCGISATRIEAAFIESPVLEPSYLWGGFPMAPHRSKFLMARPSHVTDLLEAPCRVPGTEIEAVPLPGHFLGMVGFLTADRVFFAADAVASVEILAKYHVFYLYDVAAHLATLEALTRIDADWFVPSHAAPTQDIRPLVDANRAKTLEIAGLVEDTCTRPSSPEDVLAAVARRYDIALNAAQYVLLGSTLRSYLAWLTEQQVVEAHFEDGRLLFQRR